jgi:hypothetical protein
MGPWLVMQNDTQFQASGLEELRQLATDGRLTGVDMVQAPGAREWMYASEVPEIAACLTDTLATDEDDLPPRSRRGLITALVVAGLLGVIGATAAGGVVLWQMMPEQASPLVGEGGLGYTQMLVTEPYAPLRAEPRADSAGLIALDKDSRIELLAKRGEWYRARTAQGAEGWVSTGHVIPAYQLAGADAARTYDPLYNPDRYVSVGNWSWLQLDADNTQLTVFRFVLENESQYAMTDLVLLATIKDTRGNELERVEIAVEGVIPPGGNTMVGTLAPEADAPEGTPRRLLTMYSFEQMAASDPDLQLRYSDGIEVEMTSSEFTAANIDILQIRAIPAAQ